MKKVAVTLAISLFAQYTFGKAIEDGFGYRTNKQGITQPAQDSWATRIQKKVLGIFGGKESSKSRSPAGATGPVVIDTKPAATPLDKETKELVQALPSYKSQEKAVDVMQVEQAKQTLQKDGVLKVIDAGTKGDDKLSVTPSGVKYFSLEQSKQVPVKVKDAKTGKMVQKMKTVKYTVKEFPRLNIGTERTLSAQDFALPDYKFLKQDYKKAEALKTPALTPEKDFMSWIKVAFEPAKFEQMEIRTAKSLGLDRAKIDRDLYLLAPLRTFEAKEVNPLSEEELKLLRANILYNKGNMCHVVSGIYNDLSKTSQRNEIVSMANLRLGICSHKMGLYHESIRRLTRVVENAQSSDFRKMAMNALFADVPVEFEEVVGASIKDDSWVNLLDKNLVDNFNYVMTKYHVRANRYGKALDYAVKVDPKSEKYIAAQYVAAVSEYALGKIDSSYKRQFDLKNKMDKDGVKDKNIYSLVSLNLGRFAFQKRDYNKSIDSYRGVDRNHPLWVEAMQEQAWAQLLNGDEPGAIGNMHSIHAPYFNAVYKPESYAIRTIGYMNLCHYGDAYKGLMGLEKTYRVWLDKMEKFSKSNTASASYYKTVSNYLRAPGRADVDALPYQVIREIARQRDFLNTQDHINKIVDEKEQYGFIDGIISKEKAKVQYLAGEAKKRLAQNENGIKMAEKDMKLFNRVGQFKLQRNYEADLIGYYNFQMRTYEEGRSGLKDFRSKALVQLEQTKDGLKAEAGKVLKGHLVQMQKDLSKIFTNDEFLRYEIFAGSGENIRFHAAGGKAEDKRLPSSAVPQSKDLKWNFDGEFWEDEVGYYRSSLKSACPERNTGR